MSLRLLSPRTSISPRGCLFIIIAFLLITAGRSDSAPSYSFAMETVPYQDLQGATRLPIAMGDSIYNLDLGDQVFPFFNFPFKLTGARSLQISGNGFVRVMDDSITMVVDGFFMTLDSIDERSSVSYLLEGTPGDHVLKVQWSNAGFPSGLREDYANFQIWLYQRTGVVEIRTGPNSVQGPNAYAEGGPWLGAFISPSSFTGMSEKFWITGDPAKPVIDTKRNYEFKRLKGAPAAGTLYRLTPTASATVPPAQGSVLDLKLYPNPANRFVRVEHDMKERGTIRIADMAGNLVAEREITEERTVVDLGDIPGGVYLVELSSRNGRRSGKLTKR